MSLKNVTEAVTLNGESMVDEQVVVVFNCRVAENGIAGSITQSIRDYALYEAHRNMTRQDLQDFQAEVWEVEDRLTAEVVEEQEVTE